MVRRPFERMKEGYIFNDNKRFTTLTQNRRFSSQGELTNPSNHITIRMTATGDSISLLLLNKRVAPFPAVRSIAVERDERTGSKRRL